MNREEINQEKLANVIDALPQELLDDILNFIGLASEQIVEQQGLQKYEPDLPACLEEALASDAIRNYLSALVFPVLDYVHDQAARGAEFDKNIAALTGSLMLIQAKASINLPSNYYKNDTEIKEDILKTANNALKKQKKPKS